MAEAEPIKVCPLCAETIKAKAKICPFCRKTQGRWFFISQYDLSAVLAIAAFLAAGLLAYWLLGTSRQYSPSKYRITVLNSQFGVETTRESTNAIVSGIVTNESDYTWNLTEFEVRFFDPSGKTIDVAHPGDEYMELPVLPHSECAFHLDLHRANIPEHAGAKVSVMAAKEPGFWFDEIE